MAKHKSKKKSIKKRVQKRAAKLKEITAQDLLMNPELLQSPQFKALPMEKQFQLTSQLKQLRMMSRGGLGAPVPSNPNNGGDNSLYRRYMEATNKLQKAQNANEQLRIGLQTTNDALKHETELKKEIKEAAEREKETVKRQAKIEALNSTLQKLKEKDIDIEKEQLEKEIKNYQDNHNLQQLTEKQKELARLKARKHVMEKFLGFPLSTEEVREYQGIYQNQINSYKDNGRWDKAQETEGILHGISPIVNPNSDDESTPQPISAEINPIPFTANNPPLQPVLPLTPTVEPPNEPPNEPPTGTPINFSPSDELQETIITHNEAILEHQLNNETENINDLQTYQQSEKEAKEAYNQAIRADRIFDANDLSSKTILAQDKTSALNELKAFMDTVEHRNSYYTIALADAIKESTNGAVISAIRQKIKDDTRLYDNFMSEREKIENEKDSLIDMFKNNGFTSHRYHFAPNVWIAKIKQIRTLENLKEMNEKMELALELQDLPYYDSKVGDDYHIWSSSQTRKDVEMKRKLHAKEAKLYNWLKTDFPKKKVKVFYDSAEYTNLPEELLDKSPSIKLQWEDSRHYTKRTYGDFENK